MAEVHRQIQVQLEDVVRLENPFVARSQNNLSLSQEPSLFFFLKPVGVPALKSFLFFFFSPRDQLKLFHSELLAQLEQKLELDIKYLTVSRPVGVLHGGAAHRGEKGRETLKGASFFALRPL